MNPLWNLTSVRIGEWDIETNPDSGENGVTAPSYIDNNIVEQVTHPDYVADSRHQHNDIGLLRLARKIVFNNFIQPICLPLNSTLQGDCENCSLDVAGKQIADIYIKLFETLMIIFSQF